MVQNILVFPLGSVYQNFLEVRGLEEMDSVGPACTREAGGYNAQHL